MSPVAGKVFWLIFNPANVLVGLLVLGALLLFTRWKKTGRLFVAATALSPTRSISAASARATRPSAATWGAA